MKKFLSNYKTTIILLVAIIVGAIVGIIFQEKATILQPLGDIFLNLLLVVIVPLVFLTITTSIAKMENPKRLGKIMITIICVFVVTSLIAVLVGFASTYFVKLVDTEDGEKIKASLEETETSDEEEEELTIADRTVQLLTVNDFNKLLTKDNKIEVSHLAEELGVSQVTMRKDLDTLESKGVIKREHGFALLCSTDDINGRIAYHYEEKRKIGTERDELKNQKNIISKKNSYFKKGKCQCQ